MKAIKVQDGQKAAIEEVPVPKLRPTYVLVKTKAIALNPTDWKHVAGRGERGTTVGCDWAGEVVEIGSEVTKSLQKGDRVCGFTHGANSVEPEDGAFADYLVSRVSFLLSKLDRSD